MICFISCMAQPVSGCSIPQRRGCYYSSAPKCGLERVVLWLLASLLKKLLWAQNRCFKVLDGDCTLVDLIWSQAASLQNTTGSAAPTVATFLNMILNCTRHSPVVTEDDAGHVGCTGVAHFHNLLVEMLVEWQHLVKVLVYQPQEPGSHICGNSSVPGWVKLKYRRPSGSGPLGLAVGFLCVLYFLSEAGVPRGGVVGWHLCIINLVGNGI